MRRATILSVVLFLLAALLPNIHRVLNNVKMEKLHPFPLDRSVGISAQWYIYDIGQAASYMLIMWLVVVILRAVENYIENKESPVPRGFLSFVKVWERVFTVTLIISIFDIIHYLISFRHTEWLYLVMNGVFWIMSCHYLFKLKHNK